MASASSRCTLVYEVYENAGYSNSPWRPLPACSARQKSSKLHRPRPVSRSGVMLGVVMVPNGVDNTRPPAKRVPPGAVWQPAQSPTVARYSPSVISAGSCNVVGAAEADPTQGKISNESPLGRALIGRRVGDSVQVNAPAGL